MIEVHFVGPSLFVIEAGMLDTVLVPDAAPGRTPRDGRPGEHADGSVARPHHAGVLLLRANGAEIARMEGGKASVRFDDGSGRGTPVQLEPVPALDEVNGSSATDGLMLDVIDRFLAFDVRLTGGAISAGKPSNVHWRIDDPRGIGHRFRHKRGLIVTERWRTNADRVSVIVNGATVHELRPGERAYVYNADRSTPTEADLDRPEQCPGGVLVDHDLKWLYSLTRPVDASMTLRDWAAHTGGELVAPITECDRIDLVATKTPQVSTCFAGTWGEDKDGDSLLREPRPPGA